MLLWPSVSHSLTVQEVPNPQQQYGGWVTDMAGVLSEETEQTLNQKISDLEAQNGTEIAVVTVRDTASEATPKAFATRLFNYWGVGKAEVNNGVLWLHSVGDRRIEIETGYGIENILPDAEVGEMINEVIIPEFREDNFDAGTLAGVEALITVLSEEEFQVSVNRPGDASSSVSDGFAEMENRGDFWIAAFVGWVASVLGYGTIYLNPREGSRCNL
ncbi:MAG: TPM domain-containing protein [Sodalinema sp.]|uniref:TPM domain-containing protein n=1 Tax=Sodalinema sp. TaxID=3080550 RepID=UPI00396F5066